MILKKMWSRASFFVVSVVFLFTFDGRIVLLRKRNDHPIYPNLWGFPAGKTKQGESAIETALREVKEETKNCIPWQSLLHIDNQPTKHYMPNGSPFYFYCRSFYFKPEYWELIKEIKTDPREHSDYALVYPEKVLSIDKELFIPDAWDNFQNFYFSVLKRAG